MKNINNSYMKRRKIIYRISLITLAILVIITMSVAIYHETNKSEIIPITQKSRVQTEYEYLLKNVNGRIAVFKIGNEEPIKTLSVYVDSLPSADRIELIKGIKIADDAALTRAIEDFES